MNWAMIRHRTTLTLWRGHEVITSPLAGSLMWQFLGMRFDEIPGHPWDIRKHSSKWVLYYKRNVKLMDLRTNMSFLGATVVTFVEKMFQPILTVQLGIVAKTKVPFRSRWTRAPGVLSICWWFLGEVSWWSNQLAALCSRGESGKSNVWMSSFGDRNRRGMKEVHSWWYLWLFMYIQWEKGFLPNILVPMPRTCFMVKACIIHSSISPAR